MTAKPAQVYGDCVQEQVLGDFHQPNSHENWRRVRAIQRQTPGGNALKSYSSVRMRFAAPRNSSKGSRLLATVCGARLSKTRSPRRSAREFDIMYDEGISVAGDLIDGRNMAQW